MDTNYYLMIINHAISQDLALTPVLCGRSDTLKHQPGQARVRCMAGVRFSNYQALNINSCPARHTLAWDLGCHLAI